MGAQGEQHERHEMAPAPGAFDQNATDGVHDQRSSGWVTMPTCSTPIACRTAITRTTSP
jgi:hypothetical protein